MLEERSRAVVTLRLNRPEKLNALNPEMCRALVQALLRASDDKSVRVVVLTGAGRGFCSGGDINYIHDARAHRSVREFEALLSAGKEICLECFHAETCNRSRKRAGGRRRDGLALACDLRIHPTNACSSRRSRNSDYYPDLGATFFLPRLVGMSRASELFYTSERLWADEARRIGIVYQVFPHEQFDEEARNSPNSLRKGRHLPTGT